MKKLFKFLLVLVCVFMISACGEKGKVVSDGIRFKEEYEALNGSTNSNGKEYIKLDISEDNIVKYSNLDEVIEILQEGTGVIYLGYPECPWCRNAISVLLSAADSTSLEDIYYVNMYDVRDKKELDEDNNIVTTVEAQDGYYELLDELSDILDDYILNDKQGNSYNTGEKRIYVPTVLFVRDGELVDYHVDTVESQKDPYVALNEDQTLELYDIYLDGIHDVLDDQCDDDEGHC